MMRQRFPVPIPDFDGATYERQHDHARLGSQLRRIFALMKDGRWRTLGEISAKVDAPEASISAQLRHLRKERFGSWQVDKRHRGDRALGLYEYRLVTHEGDR